MNIDYSHDEGTLQVLLENYLHHRLPRLLDIKDKIDAGEILQDFDIDFLNEGIQRCASLRPLIDRHPESRNLVMQNIALFSSITERALENERHLNIGM